MTELYRRGRLGEQAVPPEGERFAVLHEAGGAVVEEIVSGPDVNPNEYDQPHDEWVAVLEGSATLDVAGEAVELAAGDWLLISARVDHTVVRVEAGTRWLAVHFPGS